jgi:hypothetical protein
MEEYNRKEMLKRKTAAFMRHRNYMKRVVVKYRWGKELIYLPYKRLYVEKDGVRFDYRSSFRGKRNGEDSMMYVYVNRGYTEANRGGP